MDTLTRMVGGGSSRLPGARRRLEEAEKVAAEWLEVLERRRAWREFQAECTNPVVSEWCYPVGPGPYNCGVHMTEWRLEDG